MIEVNNKKWSQWFLLIIQRWILFITQVDTVIVMEDCKTLNPSSFFQILSQIAYYSRKNRGQNDDDGTFHEENDNTIANERTPLLA